MGKKKKKRNKNSEYFYQEEKKEVKDEALSFVLRIIVLFSVLFALVAPLVVSTKMFFPFVGPKSLYFMFFAQIAFFSWAILAIHNRNFLPSKNIILLSLSLFTFVLFLNTFFGVHFQNSFWSNHERMTGFLMYLHLFGFFVATSSVFKEYEWKIVFSFTACIASILGIVAIYDRFIGVESMNFSGGSTTGNTSYMGTYLLFNVFIAAYLFLKNKGYFRILGAISFVLIALSLIYNRGGRAALLSFVLGMILVGLIFLFLKKKGFLRNLAGATILVALFVSFVGFFIVLNPTSENTEQLLERLNLGTIGGRTVVWDISIKSFLDRPFFGWGLENFSFAFSRHYDPCFGTPRCGADTLYDKAHNFWYDNLVAFGIIGSVFYFFLFGSVLYFLWRKYFREEIGFEEAGVFTGLFVAYFIQGLTVFDVISSLMLLFIIFAFISSLPPRKEYSHKKIKDTNWFLVTLISLVFIFYLNYFVIKPYQSSLLIIKSFQSEIGSEKRINFAREAIYKSPLGRRHTRRLMATRAIENEKVTAGTLEEIGFFIGEIEKEIEESPFDYDNRVLLGRIYLRYADSLLAFFGDNISQENYDIVLQYINDSIIVLEDSIEISPEKQKGYWFLAEAKIKLQRTGEAFALLEKAVELEPQILNSHLYLIKVAKEVLRDDDLTLKKIKEAKEINPDWDFSYFLNQN